jgi:hypothetical protein
MTSVERIIVLLAGLASLIWIGCDRGSSGSLAAPGVPPRSAGGNSDESGNGGLSSSANGATEASDSPPPLWPPGLLDIAFDDIQLDLEKDEPFARTKLTERIEQLHERDIRIRGYMLPGFQQRGIKQFVLVRDNLECCFGPGAALHDCVIVDMEAGKSVSYHIRPVTVDGRFSIRELKGPDGRHLAIYHMSGRRVK